MTLDEAIRIREEDTKWQAGGIVPSSIQAKQLGMEAMKRIRNARLIGQSVPADLLPSETEEAK